MKGPWHLSAGAFEGLLTSLDPDREKAGQAYERLRLKLVKYFEWRDCSPAEDHADEVLNRLARRLDEGIRVENLGSYVYGVARFVRAEAEKRAERERKALHAAGATTAPETPDEPAEQRMACLEICLGSLPSSTRDLILGYYRHERSARQEARRALAESLGIPMNALRIRAHRIRSALEACVSRCREGTVAPGERARAGRSLVDEG